MQWEHSLHKATALLEWLPYQKSNPNSALGPQMKWQCKCLFRGPLLPTFSFPSSTPRDPSVYPWNVYTQNELHLW